ncbi:hypothetical protein ACFQ0B_40715 [Nonomuraea thailandensis]
MSRSIIAILAAGALLAGCAAERGASGTGTAETGGPEQVPHGYVEGAEETAEPQLRLVLSDGATDRAHVLDLLTGRTAEVPAAAARRPAERQRVRRPVTRRAGGHDTGRRAPAGVREIVGNGRHAFLTTAPGALRVIDSGGWTVDHGDHVHYYRAATRDLGTIAGRPPYDVTGDAAITAVRSGDGTVMLFDRARMDEGELTETGRLTADAVVPYGERLLVARDGAVQVRARTGEPGATVGSCADAEERRSPGAARCSAAPTARCWSPAGTARSRA